MNKKQKLTLFIISFLLFAALLFPPFHLDKGDEGDYNTGYSFILMPAKNELSQIDSDALFLQYLVIVTIGGALVLAFKDRQ